jgi:glycerophosphoryl diester phosphodiesterase
MKTIKTSKISLFLFAIVVLSSCTAKKNAIVAHRGAWKANNLPENSIASLRHAIDLKLAGSEFDVWRTADDSLVINHDAHYNKLLIEETNYADLINLNFQTERSCLLCMNISRKAKKITTTHFWSVK